MSFMALILRLDVIDGFDLEMAFMALILSLDVRGLLTISPSDTFNEP